MRRRRVEAGADTSPSARFGVPPRNLRAAAGAGDCLGGGGPQVVGRAPPPLAPLCGRERNEMTERRPAVALYVFAL
jgi:hypothetical protein